MATLRCQAHDCGKEFKAQMRHENKTDLYLVSCPHCGAVHESIQKEYEPSGAAQYRFRLRRTSGN